MSDVKVSFNSHYLRCFWMFKNFFCCLLLSLRQCVSTFTICIVFGWTIPLIFIYWKQWMFVTKFRQILPYIHFDFLHALNLLSLCCKTKFSTIICLKSPSSAVYVSFVRLINIINGSWSVRDGMDWTAQVWSGLIQTHLKHVNSGWSSVSAVLWGDHRLLAEAPLRSGGPHPAGLPGSCDPVLQTEGGCDGAAAVARHLQAAR